MRSPQALPQAQPSGVGKGPLLLSSTPAGPHCRGPQLHQLGRTGPAHSIRFHLTTLQRQPLITQCHHLSSPCAPASHCDLEVGPGAKPFPSQLGTCLKRSGFSRRSYLPQPLSAGSSGASLFISGASVSLPVKWTHDPAVHLARGQSSVTGSCHQNSQEIPPFLLPRAFPAAHGSGQGGARESPRRGGRLHSRPAVALCKDQ